MEFGYLIEEEMEKSLKSQGYTVKITDIDEYKSNSQYDFLMFKNKKKVLICQRKKDTKE